MAFQFGQLVGQIVLTTTAGATTTLTNTSKSNQIFTGTSAQTVVLPDATTMLVGQTYTIYNQSTTAIALNFNGGAPFTDAVGTIYSSIFPTGSISVTLQTNGTAAGTWAVNSPPAQSTGSVPSGTLLAFGGSSAPAGFLLCNGNAVSRTTFATLFAVIGTAYGVGDGTTTFNVPNSQGAFIRGAGSQTIGGVSYSATLGATQADQIQGHAHSVSDPTHNHTQNAHSHTFTGGNDADFANGGSGPPAQFRTGTITTSSVTPTNNAAATGLTVTTPSSDGTNGTPRTGLETRPANIGATYIIKT